jgi:hypothetical protein
MVGAAADEDAFVVPSSWYRTRVPRRGSPGAGRLAPVATAGAAAAAMLADSDRLVRETLGFPETSPDIAEAGFAYLDGRISPVGAAAVAVAAVRYTDYKDRDRLTVLADAWFASPGPGFAAEAFAAMLSMSLEQVTVPLQGQPRQNAFHQPVRWYLPGAQANHWYTELVLRGAHRLRALLAGLPGPEYADVVAALAQARGAGLVRRVATSYLAPDRVDWVDEDCAAVGAAGAADLASTLMFAVSTPDHFASIHGLVQPWWVQWRKQVLPTIVEAMGPVAAGIVAEWLDYEHSRTDFRRRLTAALAVLPGDDAFWHLVERADDKLVQPAVLDAARRFPRRGLRLLAADGRRQVAELLRTHVSGYPELAAEIAPTLPPEARARVEKILAEGDGVVDGPAAALPPVLADPPWLRRRGTGRPVVVEATVHAEPTTVVWLPGERDRWLVTNRYHAWRRSPTWEAEAEQVRTGKASWYDAQAFFLRAPEELARSLIGAWRVPNTWGAGDWTPRLAARFEVDALRVLVDLAARKPVTCAAALLPFGSPEIVLLMADWFARLKSVRATGHSYFTRHAGVSARTLVPAALAKPSTGRRQAEQALRALTAAGHGDEVRAAAVAHGAEAVAAVDTLLGTNPVDVLPARVPAVPAWADPAALPRIRLRAGGVVPLAATGHLLTMLAMSRLSEPYAGIEQVRAVVEPADLAGFAWALFRLWQASGSPAKDGWVLDALGLLGDDETVRRFTPVIRAWPGEGGHSRAVAGLDVLAAIGTDVALIHLNGIAQKVKFRALRERAAEKIDEVAEALGLTAEQLADRLVPDLGLDGSGGLTLDFGPRQFSVRFDEQLKPYVVDGAGNRRKDLPKPSAADDADLAAAARQRFSALKKDVRTVAADQIHRLERAMVTQRRWPAREFRDLFVGHPFLVHVVRRLVWLVHDGAGTVTGSLRVAEDRTFTDSADEPVTLPDPATVSVAHPMLLGASLAAWADLFADYEILPPFPQLAREVHRLAPDDDAGDLNRFSGRTVETVRLLQLERSGWQREHPQDAGWQGYWQLDLPDGTTATLGMDPGMIVGNVNFAPEQKITHVSLHPGTDGLDPIVLSEIIRDLEAVTG